MSPRWLAAAALAIVSVVAAAVVATLYHRAPPVGAFADHLACAECHATEWRQWAQSHHAKAMQVADDMTVLGDFRDARFAQFGTVSRFYRRDGKFLVSTEGPDGEPAEVEIKYTIGMRPLQQYLVAFPRGRLQSLTIAWHTETRRWFSLYPRGRILPSDPLHWTGRYQNWNLMCAECHTTNLQKRYESTVDGYRTTWSALGIDCQACHGPGGAHVRWAASAPSPTRGGAAAAALAIDTTHMDARAEVDACARCHSRRTRLVAEEHSGRPLLDEFRPELIRGELYYPDGQQLGEVYEYGSFRQSTMYQRGVRCTDCHDPHTATLRAPGNALCTRCHRPQRDPRFPTLPAREYDTAAHHFHRSGSPGAACVGCHMPVRSYMLVDPRRDHAIRTPRPDLTVRLGTPNACTSCHVGRGDQWAADTLAKWYGPKPGRRPHYGEIIADGRSRRPQAASELIALARDAEQPGIVRATALDLLRAYGAAGTAAMVEAVGNDDPVVRLAAVSGLDQLPAGERRAHVSALLKDPIRAVRIEAARVLASLPMELLDRSQRAALETATVEFKDAQIAMADMPVAHLNLGDLYASGHQRDLAEQSYRTALRLDPYSVSARLKLATLLNEAKQSAVAERVLKDGIALRPTQGELRYSLGLLLAEQGRLADATEALADAVRLLPDRARVRYNYGLILEKRGQRAEAERVLLGAHALDRDDPQILYALAAFYAEQRQFTRALPYAERLRALAPDEPGARQIWDTITQAVGVARPLR